MSTLEKAARDSIMPIVNGPSRQDMFAKCEHNYDEKYIVNIDFTVEMASPFAISRKKFKIEQILSIRHIGGKNGNEFVFVGRCSSDNFYDRPFTARYSTLTREGLIEVDTSSSRLCENNTFIPDLNRGLL